MLSTGWLRLAKPSPSQPHYKSIPVQTSANPSPNLRKPEQLKTEAPFEFANASPGHVDWAFGFFVRHALLRPSGADGGLTSPRGITAARPPFCCLRLWLRLLCFIDVGDFGLLEPLWAFLGGSWGLLGASWAVLEPLWALLGGSWRLLGRSWGVLEPIALRTKRDTKRRTILEPEPAQPPPDMKGGVWEAKMNQNRTQNESKFKTMFKNEKNGAVLGRS